MPLITAPHPTYVFFRVPYQWGAFNIYLDRFARMIRGEVTGPVEEHNIITDPSVEHVKELAKLPWVTVDIETAPESPDKPWTGKDPTRARLRTVGMGCETWGFSHLWVGNGPVKYEIRRILADPNILKVFHNGTWFDLRVLKRYGMETVNFADTRDMRRAVSATSKVSLAYCTSIYCDAPNWKADEEEEMEGEGDMLK